MIVKWWHNFIITYVKQNNSMLKQFLQEETGNGILTIYFRFEFDGTQYE